ncbi:hypothetical protein G6662_02250 [Polynucleobacter paneuropaeus]|nr:hypothetical protein [Polynucleobacter paneuropaeus]
MVVEQPEKLVTTRNQKFSGDLCGLLNNCMNSYKTLKDSTATDQWFRSQGLNPYKCINPDLEAQFVLAKRAAHCLMQEHRLRLDETQLKQVQIFNSKQTKATARQIFGILNLYKKIRRQKYKQSREG